IAHTHNNIHFEFDLSSYSLDDNIVFRTKLKGFESSWSNWSTKNVIDHTFLPSGSYTIQVEAKGNFGIAKPLEIEFQVDKIWYMKPASLTAFFFLFSSGLVFAGFFIRNQVKANELANYEQKLKDE